MAVLTGKRYNPSVCNTAEWTSETTNLVQDTAYLKEYRAIHHRIDTADMPRYKDRFKKYLNEQVVLDIANFKTVLDTAAGDIRQNIREINQPDCNRLEQEKIPHHHVVRVLNEI